MNKTRGFMENQTFLHFLSKKELISTVQTSSKKITVKSEEQARELFIKAMKNKEITASKIRKAWSKAMENLFFSEFQHMFSFTPTKKFETSSKLKNVLQKKSKEIEKELNVTVSNSYISKISSSPLHYLYASTFKKTKDFQEFLSLPISKQLLVSIFPEIGFAVVWPLPKDVKYKYSTQLLKDTFTNLSDIKINALLLRKYSTQETINRLGISTPQEIAGFAGLDVIEFRGSNVMLGLSGLKKRHDANVDVITRVGPFTEIESETIQLICGKGVLFKEYEGIFSLLKVLKSS